MNIPSGYDPITLNHWLWFKYQCHEASPQEFQRLFENVIKRAEPKFMQIKPYGNIGDRKCDGLLYTEGTIFQVYSPDEIKMAEVIKKIDEDLAGAIEHWKEQIKKWVFVYNARRGIAPDIAIYLHQKQVEYKQIEIDYLSNDALWEIARNLSVQHRAEVLGAPNGYEYLFMSSSTNDQELREALESSWFVIVQDMLSPINLQSVVQALEPDKPFGAPYFIRPILDEKEWIIAADYQKQQIDEIIKKSRSLMFPRFAIFSLAPIPLAIHLGFLLSDRVRTKLFQYHRDLHTWQWLPEFSQTGENDIIVTGIPESVNTERVEIVVRIAVSAHIRKEETDEIVSEAPIQIDILVKNPDVLWLRAPTQIEAVTNSFRQVLTAIREKVPFCTKIHLFYAGPTGIAISLGQQVNPRMNPPVLLYQYSRQFTPRYSHKLILADQ